MSKCCRIFTGVRFGSYGSSMRTGFAGKAEGRSQLGTPSLAREKGAYTTNLNTVAGSVTEM